MQHTIYDYSFTSSHGELIPMSRFKGNVLLIVNTATRCGLAPQFEELEMLHSKFKDRGLVVLGFPCDQFMHQEPEDNASMESSCKLNFGVTFLLSEKIQVNGAGTHPLFTYLKNNLPGIFGKSIKWNFTKFLITKEGIPYKRYAPTTKPLQIEDAIEKVLR